MVFSFSNFVLAYNTESPQVFEAELLKNTSMMGEVFGTEDSSREPASRAGAGASEISITIQNETANVSYIDDGYAFSGNLTGQVTPILTSDGVSGNFAAFYGYLVASGSNISRFVIANVTYNENNMFAIITQHKNGISEIPEINFYGTVTDEIASLSNTFAAQAKEAAEAASEIVQPSIIGGYNGAIPLDVDAQIRLRSYDYTKIGSYALGSCYLFHANELANQGSMTTYVKVNTDTQELSNYIVFGLNYTLGSLSGQYPIGVYISLSATPDVGIRNNSYLPVDNQTSISFDLPVWYDGVLGLVTIPLSIVTSSTTVSTFKTGSAITDNNISWSMSKVGGWGDSLDGEDASSARGISTEVELGFEGTIPQQTVKSISGNVRITFQYHYNYAGNEFTANCVADGSLSSWVTVLP
jgi:hypothetical protein